MGNNVRYLVTSSMNAEQYGISAFTNIDGRPSWPAYIYLSR